MLGGWVNPHREQQTIPQGQTSLPPKSFSTPTANGQIAPWSGSARGVGRGAGSHTPSTASETFSTYTLTPMYTYTHAWSQPIHEHRSLAASDFDSAAEHVQSALDSVSLTLHLTCYLYIPALVCIRTRLHSTHGYGQPTCTYISLAASDFDSAAEYVQSALDSVSVIHICTCTHIYSHTCIYIRCPHVKILVCIYYVCTCISLSIYIHIYIYDTFYLNVPVCIRTRLCTHTRINRVNLHTTTCLHIGICIRLCVYKPRHISTPLLNMSRAHLIQWV